MTEQPDTQPDKGEPIKANRETFIARWGARIVLGAGENCKGGAYSYPGALDRYERALGLKPDEAWLMKRLLTFDWDGKRTVWPSFHKISEEAFVSYGELLKIKSSLENKGYITDIGRRGTSSFSQVHEYSIQGLLNAIEWAIECDASIGGTKVMSDFFRFSNGPKKGEPFEPFAKFTTPREVNEFNNHNGLIAPWGASSTQPIPKPTKKPQIEHTCTCGKQFKSASRNPATRCVTCRKTHKRASLKALVTAK
jgi:hypothetical protein